MTSVVSSLQVLDLQPPRRVLSREGREKCGQDDLVTWRSNTLRITDYENLVALIGHVLGRSLPESVLEHSFRHCQRLWGRCRVFCFAPTSLTPSLFTPCRS